MSTLWMLSLLMTPLLDADAPTTARSRFEFRDAYREAMQVSDPRTLPEPEAVVPTLIMLYRELDQVPGFFHAERKRLKRGLELRLVGLRDRLRRGQESRTPRTSPPLRKGGTGEGGRAGPSSATPPNPSLRRGGVTVDLAGGGEASRAAELIDLIQNTIAPDTWQINGGRGSIGYFPLLHALVVRQTSEVHHQLGDTLTVLRKLQ